MKFEIPVPLKIAAVIVGATGLYTYIGQLVPQKEVLPPTETILSADMTSDDLAAIGFEIAGGAGICFTCHTVGEGGTGRFPDLSGISTRAETQIDGVPGLEYMARSIYYPDEFIVDGFVKGMPAIDKPPIGLTDDEIIAVLAYLQSLGGTPTVTLETTKADLGVE